MLVLIQWMKEFFKVSFEFLLKVYVNFLKRTIEEECLRARDSRRDSHLGVADKRCKWSVLSPGDILSSFYLTIKEEGLYRTLNSR